MEKKTIKSLRNAISVLECFTHEQGLGFNDICKKTNLSSGSVYRILNTLQEKEFIEKNTQKKYILGKKLISFSLQAFSNIELSRIIRPILIGLAHKTKETCNLAIPLGNRFIYIDTVESIYALKMTVKIGQLGYLHSSAAGKSILSFSDEKTRSDLVRQIELIKFNDNTITEKKGLLDEINKIREIGTSIDEEEEQIGAKCVGGPIMNNDKKLVGAISISAPSKRFDKNFQMLQSELKKVLELASKEVIKRILF